MYSYLNIVFLDKKSTFKNTIFPSISLYYHTTFNSKKMHSMIIAYLRVSTGRQCLSNQREEIRRYAGNRDWVIDRWVTEVASGSRAGSDRKLGLLLRQMKRGDTLIVTEVSRLSRTLTDIMGIMGLCLEKGIRLYTTKEGYSFDNSINSKVLCFAFGLVAEIERNLISLRTREALALRKAGGVALGRKTGSYTKRRILAENLTSIVGMLDEDRSVAEICRHFRVSRDTFAQFRKGSPEVQKALNAKEKRRKRKKNG